MAKPITNRKTVKAAGKKVAGKSAGKTTARTSATTTGKAAKAPMPTKKAVPPAKKTKAMGLAT